MHGVCIVVCFFFFKQKTAYEMRISDWSSDVCSSDLRVDMDAGIGRDSVIGQGLVIRQQRDGRLAGLAMAGQRRRRTLRAALAVAHPGPGGLVARNPHDVAGAAAAERTAQGDVERDQLQRGALDDPEGANEAAQSASGVSIRAGAGHRSGACEAQARDDRRRVRALAVVDIEISEGDPAVPRYVAGCWDGAFPALAAVERR